MYTTILYLAEKPDFCTVVEHGRLLHWNARRRLQHPLMRKSGEQLVELAMPNDFHASHTHKYMW